MAAKESLWSTAEVQCLLEIWADESIQEQLDTTHKNSEIFGQIRDYLHARGYQRTVEQCRDKVKKLRVQYLKVLEALRKSGGSPDEKDKFQWYDAVDKIIGLKLTSQLNVLESHPGTPSVNIKEETGPASPLSNVVDILPTPWREVSWTDSTKESLRQEFVTYKLPSRYPVSRVKALLLGPVGSGKSCFINSIKSTMYKRIVHLPNVSTAVNGFTKKLNIYDIHGGKGGSPTVLRLCDVMAIGDGDSTGLSFSDALAVIKGHVPKGYTFQPDVPVTDAVSGYKANPSLNEKVHCVLFMLDAFKLTSYPSSLKCTLRRLHTTISDLGIPQLILLTHVDQVCPAVQEDLKYVYSSQTVHNKMQKAAELVGLPLSYVLPAKNYVSQLTVDCNTDILLLSVVMSILQAVDDTLEERYPCTPIAL